MRKCEEGQGYTVFCSADGRTDSCDCMSGTYRRPEVVCRHVLALRAAIRNGWLGPPPRPAAVPEKPGWGQRAEAAF